MKNNEAITSGSRLSGTDYIFTNLGGMYRLYRADNAFGGQAVATFRTWASMWAWVKNG